MRLVRDPRPDLTPALERLLGAIVDDAGFDVDVDAIVVVAGAAHGTASASVRDLAGCASAVVVDGRARSVELALRPPFFLDGDAPTRLTTLVHELLHLRGRALRADYRHHERPHDVVEEEARAIAKGLLERLDDRLVLCLAHDGECFLRAWRHRPIETTARRAFDDDDVYAGVVCVRTPADRRGGWW